MGIKRLGLLAALAVMTTVLTGCFGPPKGALEFVSPAIGGNLTVSGWTIDDDAPQDAVQVHVYVDGGFAAGGIANQNRGDVAALYPEAGPNHGFSIAVPAAVGVHLVCAYFLDIGGDTSTPNCTFSASLPPDPIGALEWSSDDGGFIRMTGWAVDPETTNPINIYVTENFDKLAMVTANGSRPDLASNPTTASLGINHGFDVTVPFPTGTHRVCVYGQNLGAGTDRQIGCTDVNRSGSTVNGDLIVASPATVGSDRQISTFSRLTGGNGATVSVWARGVEWGFPVVTSPSTHVVPAAGKYPDVTLNVTSVPRGRTWVCLLVTPDFGSKYVSDCQIVNV